MLVITRASIIIVGESINGDSLTIIEDIVAIVFVINIDDSRLFHHYIQIKTTHLPKKKAKEYHDMKILIKFNKNEQKFRLTFSASPRI